MSLPARPLFAAASVLLAATVACAQTGEKPVLLLSADTMKMSIPGLENIKLPPQAQAALAGRFGGQRSLLVNLTRPGAPPASPTASLDIPDGLKLGAVLPLQVDPHAEADRDTDPGTAEKVPDFEIRRYWGCSETVRQGQPRVVSIRDLGAGVFANLPRPGARGARFHLGRANWTDAHWPNARDKKSGQVPEGAALPGKYALHSNFVPGVNFDIPAGVTFLDPVALTVPKGGNVLAKTIPVSWKALPGAVGYVAMATGMKGEKTMVLWTSSEGEEGLGAAFGEDTDAKSLVSKGIFLPPDRTQCFIPAGIFEGCEGVSVQLIAIGRSFTQNDTTPAVRVRVRSIGMTMVGLGDVDEPGDDK